MFLIKDPSPTLPNSKVQGGDGAGGGEGEERGVEKGEEREGRGDVRIPTSRRHCTGTFNSWLISNQYTESSGVNTSLSNSIDISQLAKIPTFCLLLLRLSFLNKGKDM